MKIKTITALMTCVFVSLVGCTSSDDNKTTDEQPVDAGSDVSVDSADSSTDNSPAAECVAASDCTVPAGPCALCDDAGTDSACPTADCVEGKCVVSSPSCETDGGAPEASPDPADAAAE